MSGPWCVAASVKIHVSGTSTTAVGSGLEFGSGHDIVITPLIFFPSLATRFGVARIACHAFSHTDMFNDNSSLCSTSLFILFLLLQITFIDFIRVKLRIDLD
jgi:hypothetical protein